MTPEFAYFLKVNVAFVLFYAFYRLLFYKDTFFKLRRASLLAFFGLALIYPLLNIQEWVKEQEPITEVIQIYSAMLPEMTITPEEAAATDWKALLLSYGSWLYWGVVTLLLARFMVQLSCILLMAHRCKRVDIHGTSVYKLHKPAGPFSFFKMIFIHPESHSDKEIDEILTHECTHVFQWHSVDVMICELITIVCWVNPFAWLLKREVRHNLEYLADNTVIQSGYDSRSYQYHLLGLAHHHQAAATLYNSFNVLHLKNRISMMNKKRSNGIGRTKYLIFIPLAAFLLLLSNIEAVARITSEIAADAVADVKETTELSLPAGDNVKVKDVLGNLKVQLYSDGSAPVRSSDGSVPQKAKNLERTATDPVFTVVEVMPKFPGGQNELLKYLANSVKYPVIAQENGIQGRVVASFIIEKDGSIRNVEVVKGVDPSLDREAIRILSDMPNWTPGMQRGQVVKTKYTVPVTFRLQ